MLRKENEMNKPKFNGARRGRRAQAHDMAWHWHWQSRLTFHSVSDRYVALALPLTFQFPPFAI